MSKQQKTIAAVAGGLVLLYLLYRWYSNNQTSQTTTGAVAPNTSSGDYASLAGQEQSDVAALQGQNSQLYSQEQTDVAGLNTGIAGLTTDLGTLTTNVNGLTSTVGGFTDQLNAITSSEQELAGAQSTLGTQVASLAAGVTNLNRAQTASIQTHRGGPFYNYYVKVTGKKPPANVLTSNFIYQGWKSGVKASALETQHPSSRNTQVAHPNGGHQQQQTVHPSASKPPAKPADKPSPPNPGVKKKSQPSKPPAKSQKTRPSGRRR